MPFHITYLGLLDSDRATGLRRAEAHLGRLAQEVVAASRGEATVEIISCGPTPDSYTLAPGVTLTVLSLAGNPRTPWDSISWELPAKVESSDLVHLHESFSRTCEVGLLVAKLWRRPVCLTEYGVPGEWLAHELRLAELADIVICHSPEIASELTTARTAELVPCQLDIDWLGVPGEWPSATCRPSPRTGGAKAPQVDYPAVARSYYALYRRLLPGSQREAA